MTREEAISWLEPFIWHEGEDVPIYNTDIEAIHMAIKALEQEPILDKIRAEIKNYKLSEDEFTEMDEDSVKWGMKIAYDIIEKYKTSGKA